MKFATAITTTPERFDLFEKTVQSLEAGGFPRPLVSVDGSEDRTPWKYFASTVVTHLPAVGAFPNWWLTAWELFLRYPECKRYCIFQDDIVVLANLREYLEALGYPRSGFCNLITHPENEKVAPKDTGWFRSNQKGLGACALMFDRPTLIALLATKHAAARCPIKKSYRTGIDQAVITCMSNHGIREYCHNPTLIQHVGGARSTLKHTPGQPAPENWLGEDYNALDFLRKKR